MSKSSSAGSCNDFAVVSGFPVFELEGTQGKPPKPQPFITPWANNSRNAWAGLIPATRLTLVIFIPDLDQGTWDQTQALGPEFEMFSFASMFISALSSKLLSGFLKTVS